MGTRKSGDSELRDRWARAGAISGAGVLAEASLLLDLPRPFFAQLADAMTRQQGDWAIGKLKSCVEGGSSHHDMEEEEEWRERESDGTLGGVVVIDSSEMRRMTSALCLRVTLLAYAASWELEMLSDGVQ